MKSIQKIPKALRTRISIDVNSDSDEKVEEVGFSVQGTIGARSPSKGIMLFVSARHFEESKIRQSINIPKILKEI
jgi:hypothetical protein